MISDMHRCYIHTEIQFISNSKTEFDRQTKNFIFTHSLEYEITFVMYKKLALNNFKFKLNDYGTLNKNLLLDPV